MLEKFKIISNLEICSEFKENNDCCAIKNLVSSEQCRILKDFEIYNSNKTVSTY